MSNYPWHTNHFNVENINILVYFYFTHLYVSLYLKITNKTVTECMWVFTAYRMIWGHDIIVFIHFYFHLFSCLQINTDRDGFVVAWSMWYLRQHGSEMRENRKFTRSTAYWPCTVKVQRAHSHKPRLQGTDYIFLLDKCVFIIGLHL